MEVKETKPTDKLTKNLAWANLGLLVLSNFFVYSTWYKFENAGVDTMFVGGLILVFLFVMAVYYLILLNWGVRLLRNMGDPDKNIMRQSIILLIANIVPIAAIYLLSP